MLCTNRADFFLWLNMMYNQGWVKLHRKLIDNPICKRPLYCHLWMSLLLMTQHTETSFIWNDERVVVQCGQLLTGRKKLSESTGIKESTVEKILKYLETEQQISQQKTTKFRIITIKNWDAYQTKEAGVTTKEQQSNNRVTTTQQQSDTYKKEEKEKKKTGGFAPPTHDEVAEQIKLKGYQNITPGKFINFYGSKGWMVGKNKMTNWKLALAAADKWDAPKQENTGPLLKEFGK